MKKLALSLVLLTFLGLFAACSNDAQQPSGSDDPPPASDQEPSAGEENVTKEVRTDLNMYSQADVATLDPMYTTTGAESTIKELMYEGLVAKVYQYEQDGSTKAVYEGRLAENWTISDDGLQYTFSLKPDVLWQNGDPFTADDVVFSLNRGAEIPHTQSLLENFSSAEKKDDLTVVVTLSAVNATFIDNMTRFSIVNEKYVTEQGENFADKPMGTGPYMMTEHVAEQSLSFSAFEDYHRGAAVIKTLNIAVIPDPTTAVMAFEAGDFDLINPLPSSSAARIIQMDQWTIYEMEDYAPTYLILNTEKAPFDDVRVRKALHYAANKENSVALARDTYGVPAVSMFNPNLTVHAVAPDQVFDYNVDKAKELLAEAGYPDGAGLPTFKLKCMAGLLEKTASVLQQDYAEIGVNMEIEVLEANTLGTEVTLGQFEAALMFSSVSDLVYPWNIIFKTEYLDMANFARYQNPELDSLFDTLGQAVDEESQKAIIKDVINYINDEVVYIPLTFGIDVAAYDKKLCFDVHPSSVTPYDMYWTE